MRRMRYTVGATLAALATAGGTGHAQDDQVPGITLEQMAERLAELEDRNRTLQGRVNELESAEGDQWLTEQRATEIRGVVTDVLADAETRTSLQSSGMTAGWDKGFFLQSPDGRFRLNVGGMVQTRYVYSHIRGTFADTPSGEDGPGFQAEDDAIRRYGWDLPHTRLDLTGHLFGKDTTFRVMGQYANQRNSWLQVYYGQPQVVAGEFGYSNGFLQLLDSWIAHEFSDGFTVKVGQFKLPFDRGWSVGIGNQLTGDRTAVALHMGLGRSQGIELGWDLDDIRARFAVSEGAQDRLFEQYRLAVTDPLNSPYYDTQAELSFSTRWEWKLAGAWSDFERMTSPPGEEFGLLVGVGGHYQRGKVNLNPSSQNGTTTTNPFPFPPTSDNNYNSWVGLTGDVTANLGGATISASAYYHNVSSGASYLIGGFSPVANSNPTVDVGTVQIVGASLYGSMYVTQEAELFAGVDWMSLLGSNRLDQLNDLPDATRSFYPAYADPSQYIGINFGGTYYIDGEDLKIGASVTYFPTSVSPNWNTPELGIRSTPTSDEYVLRGYVQLMF
ncbi:MAG: hypothetical protein VX726_03970 [Planctomycetota bacterium]|nr:hypothetical protein [Planctomycetota bacterium]MEE2894879.1 hypothetical protein [Planctomycetota bacterium]